VPSRAAGLVLGCERGGKGARLHLQARCPGLGSPWPAPPCAPLSPRSTHARTCTISPGSSCRGLSLVRMTKSLRALSTSPSRGRRDLSLRPCGGGWVGGGVIGHGGLGCVQQRRSTRATGTPSNVEGGSWRPCRAGSRRPAAPASFPGPGGPPRGAAVAGTRRCRQAPRTLLPMTVKMRRAPARRSASSMVATCSGLVPLSTTTLKGCPSSMISLRPGTTSTASMPAGGRAGVWVVGLPCKPASMCC
jgi:hypothetical protein